jgi:hypothetical protein
MANAAIQLNTEPYDASMARPMGRNSAGEGFLRGFLKHADVERFYFWNLYDQDRAEIETLLERIGPVTRPVTWLGRHDRPRLAEAGGVYIPTPELRMEAWARRASGGTAYSLTGVTHTIAEPYILDEIAGLLLAPLEPWDALICTSEPGRKAVETHLEAVAAYLQERFGATRIPPAQLVTIPLGVHADDFGQDPGARRQWRERLGIPEDARRRCTWGASASAPRCTPGRWAWRCRRRRSGSAGPSTGSCSAGREAGRGGRLPGRGRRLLSRRADPPRRRHPGRDTRRDRLRRRRVPLAVR